MEWALRYYSSRMYRYKGNDKEFADTLHIAIEIKNILEPRLPLFFVPSRSIKSLSISFWSRGFNQLAIQKF